MSLQKFKIKLKKIDKNCQYYFSTNFDKYFLCVACEYCQIVNIVRVITICKVFLNVRTSINSCIGQNYITLYYQFISLYYQKCNNNC